MNEREKFSERFGFAPKENEITVQHDAPDKLREAISAIAYESGLSPSPLREIACHVLRTRPDSNNWSEYPNVAWEVEQLIDGCEWYEVYEIIEAIYQALVERDRKPFDESMQPKPEYFEREINKFFRKSGIGWQLIRGQLQIRGAESFNDAVNQAQDVLEATDRTTARAEIHQALQDLSRIPETDITGAIQHAMAALECVVRDVSGDEKLTLGEILKKHVGLIPVPLDQAVEKAWGYSSERGRHLREGRNPDMDEAKLIVGLAAVLTTYLCGKAKNMKTFALEN